MKCPARQAEPEEWQIWTDGACHGNPGPSGIGAVLVGPQGAVVEELTRSIGRATCNVAEYWALIEALKLARTHGVERLLVFSDSTLVVEQMVGRWRAKSPSIRSLHEVACNLAAEFVTVSYLWVPREQNGRRCTGKPRSRHGSDPGGGAGRSPGRSRWYVPPMELGGPMVPLTRVRSDHRRRPHQVKAPEGLPQY